MLSRKASCDSHGQDSSYFLGWQEYEKNPYDEARNASGIIQMGLAENQLSLDLIESWIERNPEATGLRRGGSFTSAFKQLALFQDYHGLPAFKEALADFMAKIRGNKVKFDPNRIVLTAGATSANEILMFCLTEPGDAFLVPTPYYPGFDRDLKWRTGVEIVPINTSSSNNFRVTASAMEEAFSQAETLNLTVRGILITNPSNPLGTTMARDELDNILQFVLAKNIHLISDEIYSGTVFHSPGFVSISEVARDNGIGLDQVHLVYSLSKDLGLPGFRAGLIYTGNDALISTATKMSSFGLVSSHTQFLLAGMLSDENFTGQYIIENRERLRKRKEEMVMGLREAGIECLPGNSGLFCWVDMRRLLKSRTFEAEMELWRQLIYEVRLNVSPGLACHCSEPGWFRICFANMNVRTLEVAVTRIKAFTVSMHVD
ncbi:1-aminocyclopropane-1-carboxylate synthase 8-like [Punica granatum]|uniref:1-aminocyclopropane-1-carboxylate synthase 8-like n=3 Tax=Punica granatum TaxID=22663 RepID=A0A6P8CJG2_PUNGR|nr:1-aminocyclopropane-1-carboxylate synthase 8-like [Punica granatum]PKI72480.1 hypothetical protein CRG98_007147 [Punica granatum]